MAKPITHVLRGEEEDALAMINACPETLLMKRTSVDYSGRSYYATAFQAALLAHDVILCKKMAPLFNKLTDGQAEMARQFHELFPYGIPEQTPYDLASITKTIRVSSDADIEAVLNKKDYDSQFYREIKSFRENFTALSLEEKFFNPQHLTKAYHVYWIELDIWSVAQSRAFWCLVIGYMQRFLPACYAQAFCQGLKNVNIAAKNLERSFEMDRKEVFFPLGEAVGPGFDFGVYSWDLPGSRRSRSGRCVGLARGFNDFLEQIRQTYSTSYIDYQAQEHPLANAVP